MVMDPILKKLYDSRKERLFYYSPYSYIRQADAEKQLSNYILNPIINSIEKNDLYKVDIEGHLHYFIINKLEWDSNYFNINTYKLQFCLYEHNDADILKLALSKVLKQLPKPYYLFGEIPSEDLTVIQALGMNSFKLVETRLNYYCDVSKLTNPERYPVRKATSNDIPNLRRVAMNMRNDYDRVHAEKIYSEEKADEFLATYIEECVKGFTDVVLLPDAKDLPSDSFFAANYQKDQWEKIGAKVSKFIVSAVSADTNRGWYRALITEMTHHLKDIGAEYIIMNTQTTNRAVLHVFETIGNKYGKTSHIFSISDGY